MSDARDDDRPADRVSLRCPFNRGTGARVEWLEIGSYEQLMRVAKRAGDQEAERLAERILLEERSAQATLRSLLPEAAQLSLATAGISARR